MKTTVTDLFMVAGPKGPFTNLIPAIEAEVELISQIIEDAEKGQTRVVEATREAERAWTKLCNEAASNSLFWNATVCHGILPFVTHLLTGPQDNWIFGANIPGKKNSLRFFFGGMQMYREQINNCIENNYAGFKPFTDKASAKLETRRTRASAGKSKHSHGAILTNA